MAAIRTDLGVAGDPPRGGAGEVVLCAGYIDSSVAEPAAGSEAIPVDGVTVKDEAFRVRVADELLRIAGGHTERFVDARKARHGVQEQVRQAFSTYLGDAPTREGEGMGAWREAAVLTR